MPVLKQDVMQVVFINECKSREISNQMVFNVMFSFSEIKDELIKDKYCKVNLFSSAISHGASNELEAYIQPSQKSTRERFCKKKLTATNR